MKRLVVVVMVLGLIAGALGVEASAKKKKKKKKKPAPVVRVERVETAEYTAPGFFSVADNQTANVCAEQAGCLSFLVQAVDKYVSIEVTDKSGTPAPMKVAIGDEDGVVYCGKTDGPIKLSEATEVDVKVGIAAPNCQAVTTTGLVKATFSNLP